MPKFQSENQNNNMANGYANGKSTFFFSNSIKFQMSLNNRNISTEVEFASSTAGTSMTGQACRVESILGHWQAGQSSSRRFAVKALHVPSTPDIGSSQVHGPPAHLRTQ